MNRRNIGSDFDEFLVEEGILDEVNAVAAKRVKERLDLAHGQTAAMDAKKVRGEPCA